MDIEKIWQQQNVNTVELPEITSIAQLQQGNKPSPLKRMKKMLIINSIWALAIAVGYLVILYFERYWQIQLLFAALLAFTLFSIASALKLYFAIDAQTSSSSLLAELKRNSLALKKWIKIQTQMGLFLYPISAAAGFIFGGIIGSGKSVDIFLSKPIVVITLVIAMIILTPVGHWASKWLINRSFGKLQKHLDDTIADLSTQD